MRKNEDFKQGHVKTNLKKGTAFYFYFNLKYGGVIASELFAN